DDSLPLHVVAAGVPSELGHAQIGDPVRGAGPHHDDRVTHRQPGGRVEANPASAERDVRVGDVVAGAHHLGGRASADDVEDEYGVARAAGLDLQDGPLVVVAL